MRRSASSVTAIQTVQMRRVFVTTYCDPDSHNGTPRCTHFLPWTLTELLTRSLRASAAKSIPQQARPLVSQDPLYIMDCNNEPQRRHPFSTGCQARLQSHRPECGTGNRKRPRRGRLVSMPSAARDDAQASRAARWARDSRYDSLVCAHSEQWLRYLCPLGHMVGDLPLPDLQRAVRIDLRLPLA